LYKDKKQTHLSSAKTVQVKYGGKDRIPPIAKNSNAIKTFDPTKESEVNYVNRKYKSKKGN